jgi:cation diffusion facilitator family transporter
MHTRSLDEWRHDHVFLGAHHAERERRTWLVVGLTTAMMVVEIVGGTIFGSMAVVADGWHMSTHAAALSIAALAYAFARRHAKNPKFSFGTGKVGELAGFASAVALALVALMIAYECVTRLVQPVAIDYSEALLIAVLGLAVNLASAWLLGDGHDHAHEHRHDHGHDDDHGHGHGHPHGGEEHEHDRHHDHNHRAAYLHVLADAVTSVLAIVGLLAARVFAWPWIDPAVGLIGSAVIAVWAVGLIRSSGGVLLDLVPAPTTADLVRQRLEAEGDRVADLHLWRIGPGHMAVVVAVVSDRPQPPAAYKARLRDVAGLSHVTVEVHACPGHSGAGAC